MIVSTSSVSPRRINSPHDCADQAAIEDLEEIESTGEIKFCQSSCGFRHPTVQIAPVEFIKRLGNGHSSWFVESIDVPIGLRRVRKHRRPSKGQAGTVSYGGAPASGRMLHRSGCPRSD